MRLVVSLSTFADLEESGTEDEELLDMLTSPEPDKKPKAESLGVKLQINVAPTESDDHSRILPMISLGSVYLLTKPGARYSVASCSFAWQKQRLLQLHHLF